MLDTQTFPVAMVLNHVHAQDVAFLHSLLHPELFLPLHFRLSILFLKIVHFPP